MESALVRKACPGRAAGLEGRALGWYLAWRLPDCCQSISGFAMAKDDDDQPAKPASTLPNIYLDLRTNYATVPANTLSIGLGNQALFATLPVLTTLTALPMLPSLPTLSSPSSQSIGVDVPLTVDLNDHVRPMAASAAARRRPARPTGRRSRSAAGTSDSRRMFISRTAGRSRRSRCSRPSQGRCRTPRLPRRLSMQSLNSTTP